jgi:hypothetical protein
LGSWIQCCGSGSGIGCLFDPWIRDGRKSASGSGIRDEQPGSYFLELRNNFLAFFGVKIRKFFDEDPGWRQLGSGMEKFGSGINIPDPPHWLDPDPHYCIFKIHEPWRFKLEPLSSQWRRGGSKRSHGNGAMEAL